MFKRHKTEDGEILVAQMEDDHLVNTIRLHCRKIAQYRGVAEGNIASDVFLRVLGNLDSSSFRREAENQIRMRHSLLVEYVAEAALRGLDVSRHLQMAYGRSEAMPIHQSLSFLLQGDDDEDEGDYDDLEF